MAKYRHRIFEMYEFRDEATLALSPRSSRPATEGTLPETWTLKYLAVSRDADVMHVTFEQPQAYGPETARGLRSDFAELTDRLPRDSRVLFDFTGVTLVCAVLISELDLLKRQLRTKGSNLALCCLAPAVHQSFFGKEHRT